MTRFRSSLLRLVLAASFPLLLLAVGAAAWSAIGQRRAVLTGVTTTARALQGAIDRELSTTIAALEALATGPTVESALAGDTAPLHRHARSLVERRPESILNVVLYALDGKQAMNSLVPLGEPLPRIENVRIPEGAARDTDPVKALQAMMASRKPGASNLFWGPAAQRYLIGVFVPVFRDGQPVALLTASVAPFSLGSVLRAQRLPSGWAAAIIDENGIVVTRVPGEGRFIGAKAPDGLIPADRSMGTLVRGRSLEGVPAHVAVEGLTVAPWSLALSAPIDVVEAPLRRLLFLLAGVGALVLLLGSVAATVLARRMRDEVEGLAGWAAVVAGGGESPPPRRTARIVEVARVHDAFGQARAELHRTMADRLAAEAALRASELRFRTLARTLPDLLFVTDSKGFNIFVNDGYAEFVGVPKEALLGDGWLAFIHPEDAERATRVWMDCVRTGTPFTAEYRFRHNDGSWRTFLCRGVPQPDDTGTITGWVGTCTDIQALRDASHRMEVLVREVDHRARNALTAVQSVLRLSRERDPALYAASVEGRITAMARAHTLLSDQHWGAVRLDLLIKREMEPWEDRIVLSGMREMPAVEPPNVQGIALVLHELAANAVRHGGLSVPVGRVELAVTGRGDPPGIALHWREVGGPPPVPADGRTGFGLTLIDQIVRTQCGGDVTLDWRQEGLRVTLWLPPICFARPTLAVAAGG